MPVLEWSHSVMKSTPEPLLAKLLEVTLNEDVQRNVLPTVPKLLQNIPRGESAAILISAGTAVRPSVCGYWATYALAAVTFRWVTGTNRATNSSLVLNVLR